MQRQHKMHLLRFTRIIVLIGSAFIFTACGYSTADQLFISAGDGDVAKVKGLLAQGADPNHRFLHRQRDLSPYETPIIAAAENGHLEVIKILLKAGADIDAQNTANSQTALFKAVKHKHLKVITYLLDKGANPMAEQTFGKNLLMMAIEQDDFNLIKLLIKYGAWPDPNQIDGDEVAGTVGKDAIRLAIALKRPYVNYLRNEMSRCRRMLKTRISCKRI